MTTEQQKIVIDRIRAMTNGMAKDEKNKVRELLVTGAVVALDATGQCPEEWKSYTMINRTHKLFRR